MSRRFRFAGRASAVKAGFILLAVLPSAVVHLPAAEAHEFRVAHVVGAGIAGEDASLGFQLAVDESPDVSHAPGADAGDHLGGVDVAVDVIRSDSRVAGLETGIRSALENGTSVVAITLPGRWPGLERVAQMVAEADAVLVVAAADAVTGLSSGSIVIEPRSSDAVGGPVARVSDAFMAAHRRAATEAALAGYDAATVIDVIVSRLGHDLSPSDIVPDVIGGTDEKLVSGDATVVSDAAPAPSTAEQPGVQRRNGLAIPLLIVASSALAVAFFVFVIRRRRGAA